MPSRGLFITFEGGEGAGKTTQIRLLAERLKTFGAQVLTTREPGGTPQAEKIRDLVVQRDGGEWGAMAESLLFFAARSIHVDTVIRPALEAGKIVLCDRFSDSTRVYQCDGRGLSHGVIEVLNTLVLGSFRPDLTFILDVAPEVGLSRSSVRLAGSAGAKEKQEDRFERLDIAFHRRLRQGYLDLAVQDPERCRVVDGSLAPDIILKIIEEETLNRIAALKTDGTSGPALKGMGQR